MRIGRCGSISEGEITRICSDNVKDRTIQIRKKYNVKLSDAIIAASAVENDLCLETNQSKANRIKQKKIKSFIYRT